MSMKCEIRPTGNRGVYGWLEFRCERPGCTRKFLSPEGNEIETNFCGAWPRKYEIGGWIELTLGVIGFSRTRWTWLKWKLGFRPTCNCEPRITFLNKLGKAVASFFRLFHNAK